MDTIVEWGGNEEGYDGRKNTWVQLWSGVGKEGGVMALM